MSNMVKRLIRFKKIKQTVKQLTRSFESQVVILLYHRIIDVDHAPQLLCVKPENFKAHLEYLRQSYKIISLNELVQALNKGKLPRRAVVITFDDGYMDNLHYGKPLLERYGLPATVFVTAGYIGQQREFWWDELERILLSDWRLPENLRLDINGRTLEWYLGTSISARLHKDAKIREWSVLEKTDPTICHQIYRELCGLMRPMSVDEQNKVLLALRSWAGVSETGRADYRVMTADELRDLTSDGLIEIGAHTMTHPHLSTQLQAVQKKEIFESKTELESILGFPVNSFSYPFGTLPDYTPETVELVRAAGYTCACSNFPKKVQSETPHFELPRFLVRDWSVQTFADNLKSWFGG